MPLDIHVYKGPKTRDSLYGQEKYATDPNAATPSGEGSFTEKDRKILAHHEKRAMMRYKDDTAYFCSACWYVYNVICPRCKARSQPTHYRPDNITSDDPLFEVGTNAEHDRFEGYVWVVTTCRKCSFSFRVIKH